MFLLVIMNISIENNHCLYFHSFFFLNCSDPVRQIPFSSFLFLLFSFFLLKLPHKDNKIYHNLFSFLYTFFICFQIRNNKKKDLFVMTIKCIKCKKLTPVFTCDGCQQTYCDQHVNKHREELNEQLDRIERDYQQTEQEFNSNLFMQTYLTRISQWEHESIRTIQKTAEIARNDLGKVVDRMKKQLQCSLEQINQDIELNRETNDYTEINLKQWNEQLKQLRDLYQNSFNDDLIDQDETSIQLIKIINRKQSFKIDRILPPTALAHEKFDKIVGAISLSKDRLTATCNDRHWDGSTISGTNIYSTGVHSIRFRITKKGRNNLFFGIKSSLKEVNPWNHKTPFAYGWWQIPLDNNEKNPPKDINIRTNDEVTLTLDCIYNQIQFEHHRTNRYIDEIISNEQCPLPWRIAIVLYAPGDSVTIL